MISESLRIVCSTLSRFSSFSRAICRGLCILCLLPGGLGFRLGGINFILLSCPFREVLESRGTSSDFNVVESAGIRLYTDLPVNHAYYGNELAGEIIAVDSAIEFEPWGVSADDIHYSSLLSRLI